MKKVLFTALLVVAVASSAMAGSIQTVGSGPGVSYGPYQRGTGGEFTFTTDPGGFLLNGYVSGKTSDVFALGTFQTFCVEESEYIYSGQPVDYVLSQKTVYSDNAVSNGAAWLYDQFAQGTLAHYDYSTSRADVQTLQNAIWGLMGQKAYDSSNFFISEMKTATGLDDVQAQSASNGLYGVYALNLWAAGQTGNYDARRQDMLVKVVQPNFEQTPDGGTTLMLLGGALMGLGALRRKFRG